MAGKDIIMVRQRDIKRLNSAFFEGAVTSIYDHGLSGFLHPFS